MRRSLHHSLFLLVAALPVAAVLLTLQWWLQPTRVDAIEPRPLGYAIDLNRANRDELQLLPGVGPGLADAIIEHRRRLGGFTSIRQLGDVPRIGETTRARLEPWVTLTQTIPPEP